MSPNEEAPSALRELVKARVREFLREPGYVFWVFGFPLLMAIGLGLAFRSRAPELPRVALTEALPQELVRTLSASPRLQTQRLSRAEAERALASTKIDLI